LPAWEAQSVTADARIVPTSDYAVAPGDTLNSIVEKTGAGLEAIARTNDLHPPFLIQPGRRLIIPGGRYHMVRAGEAGIAIARAYGVPWNSVVVANALIEPYILRVGQRIVIPGEERAPTPVEGAAFRIGIDDIITGAEPAIAVTAAPAEPSASPGRPLPPTAAVAAPATPAPAGFLWPVNGTVARRFGAAGSSERNDGIKIAVPPNTPVLAAADGVVAYVGSAIPALGEVVIVKHGGNLATVYGHLSRLLVQRGEAVKRGQPIARSGRTGLADRAQLHFEVRRGRTPVDPLSKLPGL
jgi:murein DD-endopeptidase MepM/ murein hydrolase activator NlpD